jgi:hypothetical protein
MERPAGTGRMYLTAGTWAAVAAVVLLGDAGASAQSVSGPATDPSARAIIATAVSQVGGDPPASEPAADQVVKTDALGAVSVAQPASPTQEVVVQTSPSGMLSNMRIRGYSDVGFGQPLQEKLSSGTLAGTTRGFQIADLHLFVTSNLSEQFSFLSELLITSDFSNDFGAELDRLMIQFKPSRYFRIAAGKFNSGIGYYPNEFHRAKFFQTTAGRPMMFTDEDNYAAVLAVHSIGISMSGEVPSGSLGVHYIAEVTNGRGLDADLFSKAQNWFDENNHKAINGGLFVTPDRLQGFRAGFSVSRDVLEPPDGRVPETVTTVHAVYVTTNFELLNEAFVLRHSQDGEGETVKTTGYYTQISRRFGNVTRPYFRYEHQNVPANDPIFVGYGMRRAATAGVRFDIGDFAALKLEFDRARLHGASANFVQAQFAFAF